jgi:CheY-like chemotaxis protein
MANGSTRILLVDDEQSIQTLLSYPLRKDGYHVTSAQDGREALQRFDEARFDLVILDLMLPKLDGVEVCRQLRSRSQVPIIMLTAKGSETDKVAGLEVGADDYITKPFSMREFRSRVKAALRRSRMVGEPPDEETIDQGDLKVDFGRRMVTLRDEEVRVTYVDPRRPRPVSRSRPHPRGAARARLGGFRVPRSPHRRRAHPPPAREARERSQRARVPLHRARGRLPVQGVRARCRGSGLPASATGSP